MSGSFNINEKFNQTSSATYDAFEEYKKNPENFNSIISDNSLVFGNAGAEILGNLEISTSYFVKLTFFYLLLINKYPISIVHFYNVQKELINYWQEIYFVKNYYNSTFSPVLINEYNLKLIDKFINNATLSFLTVLRVFTKDEKEKIRELSYKICEFLEIVTTYVDLVINKKEGESILTRGQIDISNENTISVKYSYEENKILNDSMALVLTSSLIFNNIYKLLRENKYLRTEIWTETWTRNKACLKQYRDNITYPNPNYSDILVETIDKPQKSLKFEVKYDLNNNYSLKIYNDKDSEKISEKEYKEIVFAFLQFTYKKISPEFRMFYFSSLYAVHTNYCNSKIDNFNGNCTEENYFKVESDFLDSVEKSMLDITIFSFLYLVNNGTILE